MAMDYRPTQKAIGICQRCKKTVYPVEKMDVGVLYHKDCFKCFTCHAQLGLKTYYRSSDDPSVGEVYCKAHAPKTEHRLDSEALGIKSALQAPKSGVLQDKFRGSFQAEGWEYDSSAMEFEHVRKLRQASAVRRYPTLRSYKDFESHGIFEAQKKLEQLQKAEEDELYRLLQVEKEAQLEERRKQIEDEIMRERDASVMELIKKFDKLAEPLPDSKIYGTPLQWPYKDSSKLGEEPQATMQDDRDRLELEKQKLEEFYRQKIDDQLNILMEMIAQRQQAKVASMVDKHSEEMLKLIAQKEQETSGGEQDNFNRSRVPDVAPPSVRKSTLYSDADPNQLFGELDKQAIQVAKKEDFTTFTDLVCDLTKNCETELEKARAIFRWITVKDLNKIDFDDNLDPDTPLGLLRGIKLGTESYHVLFKRLCSYAGLHCEIIKGYSKGFGYKPGKKLSNKFRNSWTAVCLEGSWRFINCNWGARFTRGKKRQGTTRKVASEDLRYKYDDFYFLTDPEDHIFEHLPDDPKWQLLEPPVEPSEFIKLPLVKSPFFNNKLRFVSKSKATLKADESGRVKVAVTIPSKSTADFGAKLELHEEQEQVSLGGTCLTRIVGNEVRFVAKVPKQGLYYLNIYVANDASSPLETACVFLIKCDVLKFTSHSRYPEIRCFGPTLESRQYGVSLQLEDPYYVHKANKDINIPVLLTKPCKLNHQLRYFGSEHSSAFDMDNYAVLQTRQEWKATYLVRTKEVGFYVFSLFAEDPNEAIGFQCMYTLLIKAEASSEERVPFPITFPRWRNGRLFHPLQGQLETTTLVNVKVEVPSAVTVALLLGKTWHNLSQHLPDSVDENDSEDSIHVWEGTVYTGESPEKLKICAKYEESGKYIPLAEYNVIED